MFNIGLPEFLAIALVAIVVIKPEQLPGLFRNLGKGLRQVGRIRNEIMEGLREVKQDLGLDEPAPKGALKGAESRGAAGPGGSFGAPGGQPPAPADRAAAPGNPAASEPRSGTESYDKGGGI
jgi:Sec-independent protein translocase protein TatA